ncbi:MAG: hypothetical protein ACKVS8_05470 [Phycisphaerales bacterium]
MPIEPTQLLLRLAGLAAGVPLRAAGAVVEGVTTAGGDFAAMLRKAAAGEGQSGREVMVEPGVDVELDGSQMARLSAAADVAASQGFDRALVLIDGKALVLDVEERTVVASVDPAHAGAAGDIEGVVTAQPAEVELTSEGEVGAAAGPELAGAMTERTGSADALLRMLDRAWDRPGSGGA